MPLFNYIVLDRDGEKRAGTIDAPNYDEAVNGLVDEGFVPLDVTKHKEPVKVEDWVARIRPIPLQLLVPFTRQFATMIDARMSALQAMVELEQQADNPKFRAVLSDIVGRLEGGQELWRSLAEHPEIFDKQYVAMVRAGESAGNLDGALKDIAAEKEADLKLRRQVKSATVYPKVIMTVAFLIMSGLLLFIVPTFANMFKTAIAGTPVPEGEEAPSTELPLPTRIVVGMSHILYPDRPDKDLHFWLETGVRFVGAFIVIMILRALIRRILREDGPREWWDRTKLKLPMKIGPLIQKIAVARFARSFSALLAAQVPAAEAMDIVAETSGNFVLAQAIQEGKERLLAGNTIHGPLARAGVFPSMVTRMIQVGEETGELEEMLSKIAEHYQDEVDNTMKSFSSLIEPLMILAVGLMVGAVVIACYLPMFQIYDKIG